MKKRDKTQRGKHNSSKARQNFQQAVARHHVCEKSERQTYNSKRIGNNLNKNKQRSHNKRRTRGKKE